MLSLRRRDRRCRYAEEFRALVSEELPRAASSSRRRLTRRHVVAEPAAVATGTNSPPPTTPSTYSRPSPPREHWPLRSSSRKTEAGRHISSSRTRLPTILRPTGAAWVGQSRLHARWRVRPRPPFGFPDRPSAGERSALRFAAPSLVDLDSDGGQRPWHRPRGPGRLRRAGQ
jgi:hypothetical protein